MVEFSDAVTNPGTVMVHPHDALFANFAVVDSRLLHQLAFEAIADTIETIYLFSECCRSVQVDLAWSTVRSPNLFELIFFAGTGFDVFEFVIEV